MQMCNQFQNSLRMLGACGRRPSLLLYTTCWTKDGAFLFLRDVRLSIFESQSLWKEWEFTMIYDAYDEYWWIKEVLPMLSCWLWHFSSSMQNKKRQTFVDISKLGNFLKITWEKLFWQRKTNGFCPFGRPEGAPFSAGVVSSAVCLLELCGLETEKLRVDVEAAKRYLS